MDPDAAWLLDDDNVADTPTEGATETTSGGERPAPSIPTGPPVPNPYAHILEVPCKKRQYTHWARNKHLQYQYLNEYLHIYYNDYIDFMDKRQKGVKRDVPRPYEWGERALKVYAKDQRLSANDRAYWYTSKNQVKPMYSIFHPVHSKDYYDRQYKEIMC